MKETAQIVFMQILETEMTMEECAVKAAMVVIIGRRTEMVVFIMKENRSEVLR